MFTVFIIDGFNFAGQSMVVMVETAADLLGHLVHMMVERQIDPEQATQLWYELHPMVAGDQGTFIELCPVCGRHYVWWFAGEMLHTNTLDGGNNAIDSVQNFCMSYLEHPLVRMLMARLRSELKILTAERNAIVLAPVGGEYEWQPTV